jgi:hypothetical protein
MGHRRAILAFLTVVIAAPLCAVSLVGAPAVQAATLPVVSIGSASVMEGNSGSRTVWLPVTLSAPSASTVSVQYATAPGSATASDFVAASGTLTFAPNVKTQFVVVTVLGDTTAEPSEVFTVKLSAPSGATLGPATGTGTILNDDPSSGVGVGIGNATVVEGNVGARAVWFAVTLSTASASPVSVHFATAPGTATAGSDFGAASGAVSFPAGVTSRSVAVTVNGDTTFETSETFSVALSAPVGATIARSTGIGTIVNDDAGTCGIAASHPARYTSVVVFAFENRTWAGVGGVGFGGGMPYLHGLAQHCPYFKDWTETDTTQPSVAQYVGQITGARQPGIVQYCQPSATCSTTANNLYRQARRAGIKAINYVEDATTGCSDGGDARRKLTIPDFYMWGADDQSFCTAQIRPLSEFDPKQPPSFAFITPNRCNQGHDCDNATVDAWAKAHVQPVLNSNAYRAGKVAVFIWYDEDHPVPNLWITPTGHTGALSTVGAGYAGTLSAWESMLGLPCLANACSAPDLRTPANT